MIWENLKRSLLEDLAEQIDDKADPRDRESLHNLAAAFYHRFAPEDMRDRSVENLYGCLYGLLRFLRNWDCVAPKIESFAAPPANVSSRSSRRIFQVSSPRSSARRAITTAATPFGEGVGESSMGMIS